MSYKKYSQASVLVITYLTVLYAAQSNPAFLVKHFSYYILFRFVALITCCQLLEFIFCGIKQLRLVFLIKNAIVFSLGIFVIFMMLLVLPSTIFDCADNDGAFSIISCLIVLFTMILFYFLKIVVACSVFNCFESSITLETIFIIKRYMAVWLAVALVVTIIMLCMVFFSSGYQPEFTPPRFVVLQDSILLTVFIYFLHRRLNR